MIREKKLSRYLVTSALVHILLTLAISVIYAEQRPHVYRVMKGVTIRREKPEPPPPPKPKPKVVTKTEPEKTVAPKKQEPKVIPPKVTPPKVTQQKRRMNAPAPGVPAEKAPQRSRSAPGIAGLQGRRGAPGDRPGMRAAGGVNHPTLTTEVGGSGLSPGLTHGSMKTPVGSGQLPGRGGKSVAGFRMGTTQTGTGGGKVDILGSGGTGGSRGNDVEGPGSGLSTASRVTLGSGKGTTGLGVGSTDGMGEIESESGGGRPGGGSGGPGSGGISPTESRGGPGLANREGTKTRSNKELPGRKGIPEEERSGATGREEFKADLGKDMTNVPQVLDKPASRGYEDALQGEINKNLHTLRKVHEDWQNLKIPNIPKVLQITIVLDMENGKPKLLNTDFHNPALAPRVKTDLTEKIKDWKFKSLYDGKDDPEKWPIKLSGKISWQ